ncbi:MAG: rRNA pseudouridine synthase [Clostridiales bacterium]|nr:rRNA pseudouridine synthase [Clostridiales bacterium]
MRLDRILANSGYGTRTEIKELIRKGKVTVNETVIKDPGHHVSETDVIRIGDQGTELKDKVYLLLDKPDNMLTACEDKRLPTVFELVPDNYRTKKISPVGRLDYHTTGLLILTNDGELSHRLTSPRYRIPKVYRVTYEGEPFTEEHIAKLSKGITLNEKSGPVKLAPCEMSLTDSNICELTLYEGKTHEVRRIISHFERTVKELRRIRLGNIELKEEKTGAVRELTPDEISGLYKLCGL